MAEHGVEGYNNSGVSTQLVGDFIEVPHEKPWRYEENGLTVTFGLEDPKLASAGGMVYIASYTLS